MFDRKAGGVVGFVLAICGMALVLFFFKTKLEEQQNKYEEPPPELHFEALQR